MLNTALVRALATGMREAIEALPRRQLPPTMLNFPKGSCGDASLLLGAYLSDNGLNDFVYIVAERGGEGDVQWASHSWLAKDNLIIDITADQFPDGPSKIIVAESPEWHRQFRIIDRMPGDFRKWTPKADDHLPNLYSQLLVICNRLS